MRTLLHDSIMAETENVPLNVDVPGQWMDAGTVRPRVEKFSELYDSKGMVYRNFRRAGAEFVIVILIVIVLEKPVLGFDYDYEYDYEYEKNRLGFIASQVDKNIRITPGAKNLL